MKETLTLRKFINRLEQLSHNGENDNLPVGLIVNEDEHYAITNAWIAQDPNYDFDTANCGTDQWIDLGFEETYFY